MAVAKRPLLRKTLLHVGLLPFLLFALFPFYHMTLTSLKQDKELYDRHAVPLIIRQAPTLEVIRTGTDNIPFTVPTLGAGVGHAAQPNYDGMAVPSVWRTNRTMAAAKVDALSSGGMDDFEIPAFLRRQAD
mgnify:CR=1 FL=1